MNGFAGLRVGLVGPLPPPAGGMANQTRQLAELLRAAGATVHLVQSNAPYRPAPVARWPVLRAAFRLLPYLAALWRAAGRSDVFHVMANSGWSWHLFAVPAIWIAYLRKTPVVLNYRGGEAPEFLRRAHASVRRSMQRVARLAVPSRFLKEAFEAYGMHCEVLPNIVDLDRFRPAQPREPAAPPHLAVARNLEPIYDNETALCAFAQVLERLPEARLTLAGSGPEEGRLRALAARLGVTSQVRFAGRLDRDAMAELYRSADLVLNPSLADNMPNSLLEAMASGVAIVSTAVGGIPDLVEDGVSARLVPAKSAPAMAAAALELLADAALRTRLAGAALREVECYRWTRVGPVLASLYRAAMDASPRAATARAS
jgi:glycosyltransferase involved in cell wall biosynthesis